MEILSLTTPHKNIKGTILLNGSKSIANRALLIQALCTQKFDIYNLSNSDDTQLMQSLLHHDGDVYDAHHAGTTFRFLTAFLSRKEGTQWLTGSARMKQRPIKALVDALNTLGADIEYVENVGYPPLKINSPKKEWKNTIQLPADVSSQYITALLLIAPTLPHGLTLELIGDMVSKPYIEMTIAMMSYFGIEVKWEKNIIIVPPKPYLPKDFYVEGDWSAASYYYSIAALSDTAHITLDGLHHDSMQGDSVCALIGASFGIKTVYGDKTVTLIKEKHTSVEHHFEYNFIEAPDIAQSFCVTCAGLGKNAHLKGLKTLRIKETDRISALQNELAKVNVKVQPHQSINQDTEDWEITQSQKATPVADDKPFATYHDHRMAMSFAPLAILFPIRIEDPQVVSKSYPDFWKDLSTLGFKCDFKTIE